MKFKLKEVEGLIEAVEIGPVPGERTLCALVLHILPPPNRPYKGHEKHLFVMERSVAKTVGEVLSQKALES